MEWLRAQAGLTEVQANLVLSVALILVLVAVWSVVVRSITRRVDDSTVWYGARKATSYVVAAIAVFSLLWLWVGALRQLATFLGLLSAGIAIALADVLKNVVGWIYLILRRPYRVDDRVEIGAVAGDVIDIRVFRTTLLEINNWVDADQSTGRIVHVPNGRVFSDDVFNFTEGFGYIWHEIVLRVTFESDWRRAERLMLDALQGAAGHTVEEAASRIRNAARAYKIRYTHLAPTVYVSATVDAVVLTGRLLVDARRRRAVDQQVWRSLLDAIPGEPEVDIAYPTSRTFLRDPIAVTDADTRPRDASDGRGPGGPGAEEPRPERT